MAERNILSFWKKILIFYVIVFILSFFNQRISQKVIFLRAGAFLTKEHISLTVGTTKRIYGEKRKILIPYPYGTRESRTVVYHNQNPLFWREYTPIENFWIYITYGIDVALCFIIIIIAFLIVLIIMAVCLLIGVILSILLFIVLGIIYLFGARQAFGWIEFEHLFLWHYLPSWDAPFYPLFDITNIIIWTGKVIFIIINNIPLFLLFYLSLALVTFSIRKLKPYPVRLREIKKEDYSKLRKYFEKIHQWENEGYDTTEIKEFFKKQGINIE